MAAPLPLAVFSDNPVDLLAFLRLSEYKPITMLASAMVRILPSGVNDRSLAHLDDAVTGTEAHRACRLDKLKVGPLVPVMVDVIGYLAQQYSFGFQDAIGFFYEGWVRVGECISVFLCGPEHQPKTRIEVLRNVSTLVRNVRRIVYNHVEGAVTERHAGVITDNRWPMPCLDVHPNNRARTSPPESAPVDCCVENPFWCLTGVEN